MEEIEIIETLAQDHMRHYGYEFMTSANSSVLITPQFTACARQRSNEGREQAWRQLAETNYRDFVLRRQRENYLLSRNAPGAHMKQR
jgi:hypothetical protein